MNPRKYWSPQATPPPVSQPASMVSEAAALSRKALGSSWYLTITLSSVWTRLRSVTPGASLNLPYDCQPLMIQGSIFKVSLGKIWMRAPLKNHGVFDETYEG